MTYISAVSKKTSNVKSMWPIVFAATIAFAGCTERSALKISVTKTGQTNPEKEVSALSDSKAKTIDTTRPGIRPNANPHIPEKIQESGDENLDDGLLETIQNERRRFLDEDTPSMDVFSNWPVSERLYDVESYALSGRFDWKIGFLVANVQIQLTLDPSAKEIRLDSKVPFIRSVLLRLTDLTEVTLPFKQDFDSAELIIDISSLTQEEKANLVIISIDYETPSNAQYVEKPSMPGLRSYSLWGLKSVDARIGDPVSSRIVYTFSEPTGASTWLPCNNWPNDRAKFSVSLDVDVDENVISNGDLIANKLIPNPHPFSFDPKDPSQGSNSDPSSEKFVRRVEYSTQYSIPTYLMAFAAGEFTHTETLSGHLPISVWHRKGFVADDKAILDATEQQLKHFESLLGSFPFEKYAVVLVPEFRGGIEHASITFVSEDRTSLGKTRGDYLLLAHELGHQWFGDWITVEGWDDLWIKEGMASLLSAESTRLLDKVDATKPLGEDSQLRLYADQFYFDPSESIIDRTLNPEEKYTTGPYNRAAWLLTQLRSTLGEDTFWDRMREVLNRHAQSSVSTDEFVSIVAEVLSEEQVASFRRSLESKRLPAMSVSTQEDPDNVEKEHIYLSLDDPEQTFYAPLKFSTFRLAGHELGYERQLVVTTNTVTAFDLDSDEILIEDPSDVHPPIQFFFSSSKSDDYLAYVDRIQKQSLLTTTKDGDMVDLSSYNVLAEFKDSTAQEYLLNQISSVKTLPASLTGSTYSTVFETLKSPYAQIKWFVFGCGQATKFKANDFSDEYASLIEAMKESLIQFPLAGLSTYTSMKDCDASIRIDLFGKMLTEFSDNPWLSISAKESMAEIISTMNFSADDAFKLFSDSINHIESMRIKKRMLSALATSTFGPNTNLKLLSPSLIEDVKDFARNHMTNESETSLVASTWTLLRNTSALFTDEEIEDFVVEYLDRFHDRFKHFETLKQRYTFTAMNPVYGQSAICWFANHVKSNAPGDFGARWAKFQERTLNQTPDLVWSVSNFLDKPDNCYQ